VASLAAGLLSAAGIRRRGPVHTVNAVNAPPPLRLREGGKESWGEQSIESAAEYLREAQDKRIRRAQGPDGLALGCSNYAWRNYLAIRRQRAAAAIEKERRGEGSAESDSPPDYLELAAEKLAERRARKENQRRAKREALRRAFEARYGAPDSPRPRILSHALLLPLSLSLLLPLALPACTSSNGLSVDPLQGICFTRGDYRGCLNPLTGRGTLTSSRGGQSLSLTYDKAAKQWRGRWPDGTEAVYEDATGFRLEPARPSTGKTPAPVMP
jgi:hypothetical protein